MWILSTLFFGCGLKLGLNAIFACIPYMNFFIPLSCLANRLLLTDKLATRNSKFHAVIMPNGDRPHQKVKNMRSLREVNWLCKKLSISSKVRRQSRPLFEFSRPKFVEGHFRVAPKISHAFVTEITVPFFHPPYGLS